LAVEKVFARKYPFVVKVRIYERLSEISHISIRANGDICSDEVTRRLRWLNMSQ